MKVNKKQIGIAMAISMLLMAASVVVVKAAPVTQEEPMRMNLVMALIIGIMYYFSMSPWFANLGFTVLYRPLVAGTLVGIVMGRPGEGIAIGANINVLYLGWISAGGSLPGDPGLAGYLGTALALGGGLGVDAALAVAAPLGLLGGLTWSLRMSACSIIPHWADKFAEEGDVDKAARSNYIYSQPFLFLIYAVPVMIAAYLGSAAVASALGWIATNNLLWIMGGLFAASGMLSALGIALNLKFLFQGNVWPYFFVGFLVTSMMSGSANLLVMAIIGACLAYVHVLFTEGFGGKGAVEGAGERKAPGLLTRNDIFQAWVRWLCFSHSTYNWERMQGMGFMHSMTPIIKKLYKSKEDISAALKRHMVFFNTQPDMGGVIHGVVIAMEEERAAGADISDDAINSVKTGLMGPMAGIGDTLQQGILIPIALSVGISIALGGNIAQATSGSILGPLVFVVLMAVGIWGGGWFIWWQGYKQGRAAVTNILRSGTLNRVITGAGVLGNFIMGALVVQFVSLSTSVGFMIGGTPFELQPIIDSFMPNLLPLLLVLLIWWLVAKKNVSPTTIMIVIILVGVLGSYPLWPGIDAETGEAIKVGLF
ncbi:MAG: PTS system mannose/fructose/sorbose family transporter subunit IID [Chloroflexota bacterium]|nr:PTS system mannose/fructose/sorbose family transporter subunit IID [Chloroflexota bacterium]